MANDSKTIAAESRDDDVYVLDRHEAAYGPTVLRAGFWTITALVLLRLAVGWHFYSEGVKKLEPGFTSAGLLRSSVGPLAPVFYSFLPNYHGYQERLATPLEYMPPTSTRRAWDAEYVKKQKEYERAVKEGETDELFLVEFPPGAVYTKWAEKIDEAWRAKRDQAIAMLPGDEAKKQAEQVYREHLGLLANYLESEEDAIAEYRHELWRLRSMQETPGSEIIDFKEERIAEKTGETGATGRQWQLGVEQLEDTYDWELIALAGDNRKVAAQMRNEFKATTMLDFIDKTVACVVIGVGVCMLLGLCTRLAGVVGALFLLSVMASQPPWVYGANTEYLGYQMAEVGAMLTLAATAPGRWFGLDSVLRRVLPSFLTGK